MTIPAFAAPYGDLTDGTLIDQNIWNGQFDTIFNYLNATLKPAIDTLQASAAGSLGPQGASGGRLTLGSATNPVPNAELSNVATLTYAKYVHDQLSYFNGTSWVRDIVGSLSLSLTGLKKWVPHDIFYNGGSAALAALEWKSVVATNSPTSGSSKTININNTSGVAVGDWVTIRTTAGPVVERALVDLVTTNTSIRGTSLANSHTTPTVYFNSRATALSRQDGVLVKSTQLNQTYLGSILPSADGFCDQSFSNLGVWNNFNRVPTRFFGRSQTDSYSYAGTTWRPAENVTTLGSCPRAEMIIGIEEPLVLAEFIAQLDAAAAFMADTGLAFDTLDTPIATHRGNGGGWGVPAITFRASAVRKPKEGYRFIQCIEKAVSGTPVFYPDNGGTVPLSYLEGWVMA